MIRIRGAGREEYYQRLQIPLRIEALVEATYRRDKRALQRALADARDAGLSTDNEEYVRAEKELKIVETREELRDALRRRDIADIRRVIEVINDNNLYLSQLQHDIIDAEREADHLERLLWHNRKILHMNKQAMSEMRRYHSPPRLVQEVMQGVMLLFEVDEHLSTNWKLCQQFLNPYGRDGMLRKVVDFEPGSVHPEIAARVRDILELYALEEVQAVSPTLGTFYVWALGVVDAVDRIHQSRGTRPASIKRQRALFRAVRHLQAPATPHKKDFAF